MIRLCHDYMDMQGRMETSDWILLVYLPGDCGNGTVSAYLGLEPCLGRYVSAVGNGYINLRKETLVAAIPLHFQHTLHHL